MTNFGVGDLNAQKTAIDGTPEIEEHFTLGPAGNWANYLVDCLGSTAWDEDRTHNAGNEVTGLDGSSTMLAYDAAGNMTKVPDATDWAGAFDLSYDAWNRLVKVEDGQQTLAEFEYDGLGRRIARTGGGTTRHYYYSAMWQVLEERLGSSTVADRQYVWGDRYVDEMVLRDRDADANSGTGDYGLGGSGLEERLYALQDANFNTVAVAEPDGDVAERYNYYAYGWSYPLTPTFWGRSSTLYDWQYLYTGRDVDLQTGLYNYRTRPYHPYLGRFTTRDPIGYWAGDANLYRYVFNSPLRFLDPFGFAPPYDPLWYEHIDESQLVTVPPDGWDSQAGAFLGSLWSDAVWFADQAGGGLYDIATTPAAYGDACEAAAKAWNEERVQPLGQRWYNMGKAFGYTDEQMGDQWSASLAVPFAADMFGVAPAAEYLESWDFGEERPLGDVERAQRGLLAVSAWAGWTAWGTSMAASVSPALRVRMYADSAIPPAGGGADCAEAARYQQYWEGLTRPAPVQGQPYEIIPRYTPQGVVESYTTYDALGFRAYQYEVLPGVRHGPGFHVYDQTPPLGAAGNGPRGPHIPFGP